MHSADLILRVACTAKGEKKIFDILEKNQDLVEACQLFQMPVQQYIESKKLEGSSETKHELQDQFVKKLYVAEKFMFALFNIDPNDSCKDCNAH